MFIHIFYTLQGNHTHLSEILNARVAAVEKEAVSSRSTCLDCAGERSKLVRNSECSGSCRREGSSFIKEYIFGLRGGEI